MSYNLFTNDNFTAVLFFKGEKNDLISLYKELKQVFNPTETILSILDLNTFDFNDFDIDSPFEDDETIRKIIFHKGEQQLTLEYYRGQFLVEHLLRADIKEGYHVIKSLFHKCDETAILILGFELSLDISSFSESMEETKHDKSLHPITVIEKASNGSLEKNVITVISDSDWSKERIKFYDNYFKS